MSTENAAWWNLLGSVPLYERDVMRLVEEARNAAAIDLSGALAASVSEIEYIW